MRLTRLSRSVTAKITEQEFADIEQLAAGSNRNISECVRECLLRELQRPRSSAEHEALLAEVLALRAIMLNLAFRSNAGEKLTEQEMRELIQRSDHDKTTRARQRLTDATLGETGEKRE